MNVIIVGGGYAGLACATRLMRRVRQLGHAASVTLINDSPFFVERIRLHQAAAGQWLRQRSIATLLRGTGVRLLVGSVEHIDLNARSLTVNGETLRWDRLVLAVGSKPGHHGVAGAAVYAMGLQPDTVPALSTRLSTLAERGGRVAIVGGGLTGIEAAAEFAESHPRLRVTLISRTPIAQGWSGAGRKHLLDTLLQLGVRVMEGVEVDALQAERLEASGREIPFDLCLWAAGFEAPSLPRASGLAVNAAGQILADPFLRSASHPAVYAAGDIVAPVLAPGHRMPMGCKSALPSGAHVAENLALEIAGRPLQAFDFAVVFYCISLGRKNGLIQWADANGALTGRVLTGRSAARFKELICKSTWWALVWEARGLTGILWKHTGHAPVHLPENFRLEEVQT